MQKKDILDFPGGPVVKTMCSQCRGHEFDSWLGKILHAAWRGQKKEKAIKKKLFIYFWLCWVFVSVRGLSLVVASGGHPSSRCMGLSLSWPLLLRSTDSRRAGSVVVAHGPSCSAACGILRPGLELVSPASAGRFSTTAPPGKPRKSNFEKQNNQCKNPLS